MDTGKFTEEELEMLETQAEELALTLQRKFPASYREALVFLARELLDWWECSKD